MADNLLKLAPRPLDLDGATLGALDTQAGDSARYLDLLTARLEKRHFLAAVLRFVKPSDREAYPTQLLDQLADQCDVVVTGVGQAVETAEFTALDAVALERASVPCAVLVSAGLGSAVQQAFAANGYDVSHSVIELGVPAPGQPADVQALIEASFRAVERVLIDSHRSGEPLEAPRPVQRNGEVSCEC